MTFDKLIWDNEADLRWAERFEDLVLAESTIGAGVIDGWMREIYTAIQETGSGAEELFGSPADALNDYITSMPMKDRSAVDLSGQAPISLIGPGLTSVGLLGTIISIVYLVQVGWHLDVTATALWVVVAGLILGLGGCFVWAWRTAGRALMSGLGALAVALATSGAITAAVRFSSETPLFKVPTLALTAVGLILMGVGWNLPTPTPRVDDRSRRWSAEQWFVRLEGLLRGRYHLPHDVVRRHIEEAKSYVQERDADHPFEQFGAPETYALALTEHDPTTSIAQLRSTRRLWFVAAGLAAILAVFSILASDGVVGVVAFGVVSGICAWQALSKRT